MSHDHIALLLYAVCAYVHVVTLECIQTHAHDYVLVLIMKEIQVVRMPQENLKDREGGREEVRDNIYAYL